MRPIANFALHALAAALLAAFATTSAAAAGNAYIKLGSIKGESTKGAPSDASGGGQQIEVESFSWGASQAIGPASTGGADETLTVGSNRTQSGLPTGKRQHKPLAVTKTIDKATPVLALASPLPQGSLRVKVKFPWLACREGDRYPELELGDAAGSYRLTEVIVTSCAAGQAGNGSDSRPMESISFNYAKIEFVASPAQDPNAKKVEVRGWDPERKEE